MISKHCKEIAKAEGIIIVHPNWWGQPPAILKGWIDRILRPGVAYTFAEGDNGEGELIGLLKANEVVVFNTSNTPVDRELTRYGDPLESLWKNNILISCGAKNYYRKPSESLSPAPSNSARSGCRKLRKSLPDISRVY